MKTRIPAVVWALNGDHSTESWGERAYKARIMADHAARKDSGFGPTYVFICSRLAYRLRRKS